LIAAAAAAVAIVDITVFFPITAGTICEFLPCPYPRTHTDFPRVVRKNVGKAGKFL